jgi:hypothetical protein
MFPFSARGLRTIETAVRLPARPSDWVTARKQATPLLAGYVARFSPLCHPPRAGSSALVGALTRPTCSGALAPIRA